MADPAIIGPSVIAPSIIAVESLGKSFAASGATAPVIDRLSFRQPEGEFLVIVGPSGCGKTTLLRLISGLMTPDQGRVEHRGRTVAAPSPWIGVVFQDYHRSLFPWLTVARNVGFGITRLPRLEQQSRIDAALHAVGLDGFQRHYPWQLSGGMQQRTALARALACRPDMLMLDEPFASVDAQTRLTLQDLLMRLWSELRLSAFLVTHDIEEAILMGDRVIVLSGRPTRIAEEVTIDLPRPRDQLATREDPRFLALRHHIFELIRRGAGASARPS